ncbi:hypothetical protein [Mycolicibacterium llatzerense]|uniref:hypothetical protein n=1 Tax=Mycolicibacterium llatzerense TaxID=280871 RepID=UPI0008DC7CD9|nr:hypothetical protein [Mycolicibacterium llatzerense]
MTYRDFDSTTAVFDNKGRRGLLIFDEDPAEQPNLGDCSGWITFQANDDNPRYQRLSVRTRWSHAETVIGQLKGGAYPGANIPTEYRRRGADLDAITAKLSTAGLTT